jgi:hypothetical protein
MLGFPWLQGAMIGAAQFSAPDIRITAPQAGYFLAPLDAWYAVAGVAAFAPLSCLGFFFSRLLFCSLLIFRFS